MFLLETLKSSEDIVSGAGNDIIYQFGSIKQVSYNHRRV